MQAISFTNTASDVKEMMLSNSPNLSDKIMYTLIKDNTILQNSDLLDIIATNPDVAHNEELLKMLQEKTNPMDEWMLDFLREAGTYETNRTLLEQKFAQKQYERDNVAWQIVRHLLQDTASVTLNHAELRQWLNMIGTPRAQYMIAEDYCSVGDYSAASQVLNSMNEEDLDRYERMELGGMKTWLNLQTTLNNSGRNIYQLTTAERDNIRLMAEQERQYGLAGTYAANLLNLYEPNKYNLPTIYPSDGTAKKTSSSEGTIVKKKRVLKKMPITQNTGIAVFPNPVNDILTVDLQKATEITLGGF